MFAPQALLLSIWFDQVRGGDDVLVVGQQPSARELELL
jgi:hypothetical protein